MRTYEFAKLSKAAKETARDRFREASAQDDYGSETVIEDAEQWLTYLGFTDVKIHWSGFGSQGDGACFEAKWNADSMNVPEAIGHCGGDSPQSKRAQEIALQITACKLIRPWMYATLKHVSRDYHEHSIDIEFDIYETEEEAEESEDLYGLFSEACRDTMRWIYRNLEAEYEYQNSDECVDGNIECNDYRFYSDGTIYFKEKQRA